MKPYWDLRRDRAIHEAGHLVAVWYCASVPLVEVDQGPVDVGRAKYRQDTDPDDPTIYLWNQLVISLAGITAELWATKKAKAKASQDDLGLAVAVAEELSLRVDVWKAFPVDTDELDNVTRMYSRTFSPAVKHLLEAAHLKARTVLTRVEPEFHRSVGALMTGSPLNQDSLEGLLGDRPKVAWNGSFVLPKSSAKEPEANWLGTILKGILG